MREKLRLSEPFIALQFQAEIDNVRVTFDINSLPVRNPGSKNDVCKSEIRSSRLVFGNFDVDLAGRSELKPLLPIFYS